MIKAIYRHTVDNMTSAGERHTNPCLNNLLHDLFWVTGGKMGKNYLVCASQQNKLRQELNKARGFDDVWTFDDQPLPGNVHIRLIARPKNPSDPLIYMDPWSDKIWTKPQR